MLTATRIERRKGKARVSRLGQPLFMQVPKLLAGFVLAGFALCAILASHAASTIAFGPFFILICAFGAWFVGNPFALSLGLAIGAAQILSGHAISLHSGPVVMALQLLSALAVVLMLGVAREALETEWRFARIDPLTGALNRKAFFEAIEEKRRHAGVAALVFADIDGLKSLNDAHGHKAGDEALREFADRVRQAVRKDDIFARIGGDEFVIFLRVCDQQAATIVAHRLNRMINLETAECNRKLKCSLGVLVLPAGSTSIDTELKQADALMYDAKREGGGVVIAMSIGDVVHELRPAAPSANSASAVRLIERIDAVPVVVSKQSVAA